MRLWQNSLTISPRENGDPGFLQKTGFPLSEMTGMDFRKRRIRVRVSDPYTP
jgi:hypothetical protein